MVRSRLPRGGCFAQALLAWSLPTTRGCSYLVPARPLVAPLWLWHLARSCSHQECCHADSIANSYTGDSDTASEFCDVRRVTLSGTLYGQGTRAIILSNESDNNSFAWVSISRQLATLGYLVLGYAYRPHVATARVLPSQGLRDLPAAIAFYPPPQVPGITPTG